MNDQEWIKTYLDGRSEPWEELVLKGEAPLERLDDGLFKDIILSWTKTAELVYSWMRHLGYKHGK